LVFSFVLTYRMVRSVRPSITNSVPKLGMMINILFQETRL
jgi:hypothetical protein